MAKIIGAPTLDDALAALGELAAQNQAEGRETLVFCEDRLTLLAERAVLDAVGGTFSTEVTTFARFLSGTSLSKQGSVMILSALLTKEEANLTVFRRGAAEAVYETIAQLSASRVTAELLRESAEQAEGVLGCKLRDLAYLLDRYGQFLAEHGLTDENGYLARLPDEIRRRAAGKRVVFFAFPSFTRQAQEGVKAALETAEEVYGIFLAGRQIFYTNEAARIFRKAAERQGTAERIFLQSSLSGGAKALAGALFSPEIPQKTGAQGISVFSAADEAEEADIAAALIRRACAEGKRYRDIAVLVGGDPSFAAVERAFAAYKIPYFADRRRPYVRHPFCAFVLSLLAAVSGGVLPRDADAIASSVYFGDGDIYRNYLAKYGNYRGAVYREIRETENRDILIACRERMLSLLSLFRPRATAAAFAEGIRTLWEKADGEAVTERLKAGLFGEDQFLSADRLFSVLDETVSIVGGETFTAREFSDLLKNSLEAFEISLFPQRSDAVFVGDVTESRIYRSPILFAIGISDALPHVTDDTAIITDREIAKLSALGAEIEPAIAVVNARAREAFCLNLLSFSERLYLGCPARLGGKEVLPSSVFRDAAMLGNFDPIPPIFPYNCCEFAPALNTFFMGTERMGNAEDIARYSSIREVLMHPKWEEGGVDPDLLRGNAKKEPTPEAGTLYFSHDVSPTLLETYFDCPYKSFAMRALHVAEREEQTPVDPAGAGSFVHTVLEMTAASFNYIGSAEECAALAEENAKTLLSSPRFSALSDTAAGVYTATRLIGESVAVTVKAYSQLKDSSYRVRGLEEELNLPALGMRGRADRVDVAAHAGGDFVRVIDYKTGEIDESALAYYTGRKLQLQLYLKAASEGGVAAGAFYFPAADDFTSPEDEEKKFRMRGFFCKDDAERAALDSTDGGKFFSAERNERAMPRETFDAFLDYAVLVSLGAEEEMRRGNVAPAPYDGACKYCKLLGACGFAGGVRRERRMSCGEIAEIARREQ